MSVPKPIIVGVNFALAVWVGILGGNLASAVICKSYAVPVPVEVPENVPAIVQVEEPAPEPPPAVTVLAPAAIGWRTEIRERFVVKPRVTCYSRFSGPTEAKGLYSSYWNSSHNVLPIQERIIQEHHYTVALPDELERYSRELIRLPSGIHAFRWLVHVPNYNPETRDGPEAWRYYSVPRDHCPSSWTIDVLFTGDKGAVDDKVVRWKQLPKFQACVFYEVVVVTMYNDGTEREL